MNIGVHEEPILHLARALDDGGHLGRVQRGLPLWRGLVHLLLFGGLGALLLWGASDVAQRADPWSLSDLFTALLVFSGGVASIAWSLWSWFRIYRPRAVRNLDELAGALS